MNKTKKKCTNTNDAGLSKMKRGRKRVSYKESSESSSDDDDERTKMKDIRQSDNEFLANNKDSKDKHESFSSQYDIPLRALIKKASSKMSRAVVGKKSMDITMKSRPSFANICRPNISEGESSESSGEDTVPLRCKPEEVDASNENVLNEICKEKKDSVHVSDDEMLESGNKNKEIGKCDGEGIAESSDDKLSLSSNLSDTSKNSELVNTKKNLEKEIEFIKSSPEGNESDTNMEDVDEEKAKIKKRKRIKFEDKEVETGDNKLPLSAKLSAQKERSTKSEKMTKKCELLSSVDSEIDGNQEEVDEITTNVSNENVLNEICKEKKYSVHVSDDEMLESGNKNKEIGKCDGEGITESSDDKLSPSSNLSDTSKNSELVNTKKNLEKEIEFIKSSPEGNESDTNMEDVDEEKAKIKKRKRIKFEDKEVETGDNKLPLSAKLSVQKGRSTKSEKMTKKSELLSSVDSEIDGNREKVDEITTKTKKRKRTKEDKEVNDHKIPLSAKLSAQKKKSTKREKMTKEIELISLVDSESDENREEVDKVTTTKRKRKRTKEEINDHKIPLSAKLSAQKKRSTKSEKMTKKTEPTSSDGSENDGNWEDVDEVKTKTKKTKRKKEDACKGVGPVKGLEVSVEVDSIHMKKNKKSAEEKMLTYVRQMFQRIQKNTQILVHKTHLLCLLANALNQNKYCNNDTLKAICLSMIPHDHFQRMPNRWDINHLRRFTTWFQKDIPEVQELLLYIDKEAKLLEKFKLQRIHILVIMMRSLGFHCRIIYSLLPVTAKLRKSELKTFSDVEDKSSCSTASQNKTEGSRKKMDSPASSCFSNEDDPDLNCTTKNKVNVPECSKSKKKSTSKNDASSSTASTNCEKTSNIWAEIYMETLKRWICLELASLSINSPSKCEDVASKPLQYVIGIDNNQKVKDVTCRYAEKWLIMNRKLRVDRDWWAETLDPFRPNDNVINLSEDAQLRSDQMRKEFPKTVSEFKAHPLYALQRHLLKYEAIYPEAIVPVGYINKEAIYPRDCVHVLRTQETWIRQARCIKPGEEPFKLVKGRKKVNESYFSKEVVTPCFGIWQTELYVPPPVVDGKITKNEYGNIELYKHSMLPEGAVHIPMSNMKSIARTLSIDHAQAVMGWEFHGGSSHPIFEGIVVAKEYEDILLDAWNKLEEVRETKETKKKEEVIYGKWRKLIKGLLIRERLKVKYCSEDQNDKN